MDAAARSAKGRICRDSGRFTGWPNGDASRDGIHCLNSDFHRLPANEERFVLIEEHRGSHQGDRAGSAKLLQNLAARGLCHEHATYN